MGLLNKKNITKIKDKPYHFNGDLDKLNTGDLFVRKNGIIGIVFNKSDITDFEFLSCRLEDRFFIVRSGEEFVTFLYFNEYGASPKYQINKIYPKAFTIEELKEFSKIKYPDKAVRFIDNKFNEIS